jgi:hypothetical protein
VKKYAILTKKAEGEDDDSDDDDYDREDREISFVHDVSDIKCVSYFSFIEVALKNCSGSCGFYIQDETGETSQEMEDWLDNYTGTPMGPRPCFNLKNSGKP